MYDKIFGILLLGFLPAFGFGQAVDHWEAAILAENTWRYRPGNTEPPGGWQLPGFDDSWWGEGEGGIGYGDGDDNTVISPTTSVYLRKEFDLIDTSTIAAIALYADFDDAFVTYLNGVEIARSNIGIPGTIPSFDESATSKHEAQLYQGGLPEAFPFSPLQLKNIWKKGTNTLAIQVHNEGMNSSDLSAIFFLFLGIENAANDYQEVPTWFSEPFESSNLPLLLIHTFGTGIPDDPKVEAHLGIIDNGQGQRNFLTDELNGYDGKIAIEIRGSSSQMFLKKNFGFETRLENGTNNNVSLLGMPSENDWILHGPYSDKSLMRNVLSYHIGRQTGHYAPRTRWCELMIDNQYQGLYVLTEKIKRDANRVDIAKLKPEDITGDELTGGYIFSADRDAGPATGWTSPYTNALFYRYRDPAYDKLMPEQKEYLQKYVTEFEEAMSGSAGSEVYSQYIDADSWIDYWIASEVFKHIDGYKYSFYLYKKKDSNGGKIHFGPLWDLNLAYGNFDFGQDPGPEGWSYEWASSGFLRPFWILELMDIPEIRDEAQCRWKELRRGGLHTDSLIQFIDDNAFLVEEARIRNFERWNILGKYIWPNSFVGTSYEEELDFLKNWLRTRLLWMDENMPGECKSLNSKDTEEGKYGLKVFPNPSYQGINFLLDHSDFEKAKLFLFDIFGNEIGHLNLRNGEVERFTFDKLPKGVYFYKLLVDGGLATYGKVVLQ